jgi:hypothetical protein
METKGMEPYIIRLTVPCCKRSVTGAALMLYATISVRRTCPKCKASFTATITPMQKGEGFAVHTVEWFCYKGTGRRKP